MESKAVVILRVKKEAEVEVNGEKKNHLFEFELSMPYGVPLKLVNDALYEFLEEVVSQAKRAQKSGNESKPEETKSADEESQ